jgi:hypothetical protein
MEKEIVLSKDSFAPVHTAVEEAVLDGKNTLRVSKAEKINLYDQNTYAKLETEEFHNGIIEVDMYSKYLPDAPDFARGFIGIAYRINEDDSEFESFYVRPSNGRSCTDPVRRSHGCQYFSYPGYTFDYFREFGITDFEAQVDIDLEEWIHLKAEIMDEKASFYINDKLVLVVENQKHGKGIKGKMGMFVDIGTDAYFANLKITSLD